MTDNFKIVKNKYKLMALISAIALGVFCGVIVACALLLAFKLSAIEFLWVYYVLIGVAVAVCCGIPFYLLLRPNDKKLAMKLDRQYSLNQKVQTMVEYVGADGAMVTLQREQTNEALSVAAKSRPDFKGLLKFIFVPVMAVAIACVSIIVPAKKTTVVLPGFTLTDTQRKAVNKLISDVNSSELSDGLKYATTAAMTDMLERLEETELLSKMKSTVISTVTVIDGIIAGANSYYPLYTALKEDELTKPFAAAEAQAVANYKYTSTVIITTIDGVNEQRDLFEGDILTLLTEWKEGVGDTFYHIDEESNNKQIFTKQEMVERVSAYSAAFKEGLEKVVFAGENDGLLMATDDFADDILTINSNFGASDYLGEFKIKCESFVSLADEALYPQLYACLMDEFMRNRLAEIFGLKVSEIGVNSNVVPTNIESGGSGGGGGNTGNWGTGKPGSDDMVLDPDTGELVEYGTLLESYRNKINERIAYFESIINNPDATEEQKAEAKYVLGELTIYVTQYLNMLETGRN